MSLFLKFLHLPSSGYALVRKNPCLRQEKQFFNDNVNLNDNLNFLGLSIIEVEQKERFFCEAGFFHDEIEIPERVTILVIRLSGKAAIKRGQTRTRS